MTVGVLGLILGRYFTDALNRFKIHATISGSRLLVPGSFTLVTLDFS
jgi:hypothetical protein